MDSETFRSGSGVGTNPGVGGSGQSSVREVETLMKKLCASPLFDGRKNSQELQEKSDSLMKRIKVETSFY